MLLKIMLALHYLFLAVALWFPFLAFWFLTP